MLIKTSRTRSITREKAENEDDYENEYDFLSGLVLGLGWTERRGRIHKQGAGSIKGNIVKNNFHKNSELLPLQMEKYCYDFANSYKQYLLSLQSLEQAEENYKINKESYENGLVTITDLLEAEALLRQSKDKLTDSKTNYRIMKTNYLVGRAGATASYAVRRRFWAKRRASGENFPRLLTCFNNRNTWLIWLTRKTRSAFEFPLHAVVISKLTI